jgi:hypothetical protein
MCALVYCDEGGSFNPTVTVYDLAVDPDTAGPARIEDLLVRYGAPEGTTSHGQLQAIVHVDVCPAPTGCEATINGGSRYLFCDEHVNRANAQAMCEAAEPGFSLASIGSVEENDYITANLGGHTAWFAANDIATEGSWVLDNGYSNWAPTEPNDGFFSWIHEDCAMTGFYAWFGRPSLWIDAGCQVKTRFVCEKR